METISITIPRETEALIKTADYLRSLAGVEHAEEISPEKATAEMENRIDETVAAYVAPELDKEGVPWDERIHASSKALIADGTWRLKRGVDQALVEQVKLELKRQVMSDVPVQPTPVEVPAPPVADEVPAPPLETVGAAPATYAELVPMITDAVKNQKLQPTDIMEACKTAGANAAVGAASLPDLAKAEAAPFIPLVAEALTALWATRG